VTSSQIHTPIVIGLDNLARVTAVPAVAQTATAMRESIYTSGYLGVVPVFREYLQQLPSMRQYPESVPTIVSAISGGLFAAFASQPADTIKTRMQVRHNLKTHGHGI